ncbi:MAG: alpha-L-fucosidase, partial [Anaerotignum sp.]|nr:alpha-L-fucosidase [Anaerotignum sp.]
MDAADEQPAPVSGGDRPAGDYIQLSLFPSVEEQAGNIAAAEAGMKYTMSAAFSVPEEYLDVILQTGGGRDDSRKRIYAQYQLGKTPEEISEFLQSEYKVTGKGFEFDGQPVAVWFDEHGMRLGYGTSAKESTLEIYSWEEVEKRIRSMVERGTYMAADEVTLVEESEHKRIANQIYYFFRDGINDMPDLLKTKGYGYPEFMDKAMVLLATKEGQQKIHEEIQLAKEKLDAGEVRLKWRFVAKPEYLLDQVADQWKEKAEFPVSEKVDVLKESFITQDEIDTLFTGTTITAAKEKNMTQKEILVPTQKQIEWADCEIGVIIHLDLQVFDPFYKDSHPAFDRSGITLFDPDALDTDQWIESTAKAGAKYALLTAKHGTGFTLFPSSANHFSIADTPYQNGKGDVVAAFITSCKKYGVRPGLYYNTSYNWYYGVEGGVSKDGDRTKTEAYSRVVLQQLEELWSRYGDIFEIWFDGGCLPP